jgi:hypothetical protein
MPKLTKNLLPSPVKWRSKSLSPALSTGSPVFLRCPAANSKKESIRLEREESARENAQILRASGERRAGPSPVAVGRRKYEAY